MLSAICFNLDQSKILSSVNELTLLNYTTECIVELTLCQTTKFVPLSTVKAFADDNFNVALMGAIFPLKTLWKQERQIVTRYALLTPSCNHPRNFIAIASLVLEISI